jgi:hypothetical protein
VRLPGTWAKAGTATTSLYFIIGSLIDGVKSLQINAQGKNIPYDKLLDQFAKATIRLYSSARPK